MLNRFLILALAAAALGTTALNSASANTPQVTGLDIHPNKPMGVAVNPHPVLGLVVRRPPVLGVVIKPPPVLGVVVRTRLGTSDSRTAHKIIVLRNRRVSFGGTIHALVFGDGGATRVRCTGRDHAGCALQLPDQAVSQDGSVYAGRRRSAGIGGRVEGPAARRPGFADGG